jgi:oxygen-independent coproporphyrinogen-3 oxidase
MAGIYIHIPFCKQACHYCDFHFSTSLKRKDEMIQALIKEIELRREELNDSAIETIYFGGGTPSLLTIEELNLLIETVYKNFKVVANPEITLEANPDDLSEEQINKLTNTRINRLSIGIQSFFDEDLQMMNRAHTSVEAKKSLSVATRHFDNITIDLIYGIPNMTNERWNENLQIAFDFGINHISSYALTVEPKTALAAFIRQGKYPNVSEETALGHFKILVKETSKQGFVQYEISNFGKQDYFSKHNTSYWQGKPYLGIGPSAHSFDGKQRSWNVSNNIKYIQAIQQNELPSENEILSDKDSFNEYIMTGLRTIWGVSLDLVEENFGLEFKNHLLKNSEKFVDENLLIISNESENLQILRTTSKGKFLADGIASDLFLI